MEEEGSGRIHSVSFSTLHGSLPVEPVVGMEAREDEQWLEAREDEQKQKVADYSRNATK